MEEFDSDLLILRKRELNLLIFIMIKFQNEKFQNTILLCLIGQNLN